MTGESVTIGPAYKEVAAAIRSAIVAGTYPVGEAIPTTRELQKLHHRSSTVVRRAVSLLEDEAILVGIPGKGVYVCAVPGDQDDDVRAEIARLWERVTEIAARAADAEDVNIAVGELTRSLSRIEVNMMNLYAMQGRTYPHGEAGGTAAGDSTGAVAHVKVV